MAQSLTQMYVHIIFHTRHPHAYIHYHLSDRFFSYINGILQQKGSIPIQIGGTSDHIHILCSLPKNISISDLVQFVKQNSSRWIKYQDADAHQFGWQAGYGAFSVSSSLLKKTELYILRQEEHHKKMDYKQEYILFLKKYGIEYSEKYLWEKG